MYCKQESIENSCCNQRLNAERLSSIQCLTDENFINHLLLKIEPQNNNNNNNEDPNGNLVNLMGEIDIIIKSFQNELDITHVKIQDHCTQLRDQIENDCRFATNNRGNNNEDETASSDSDSADNDLMVEKDRLLNHIDSYEHKCLNGLNSHPNQLVLIKDLFKNCCEKLEFWENFVAKMDLTDKERGDLYSSALAMKQMLLNSSKFFNSLLFSGQLLVYEADDNLELNVKKLKYIDFTYIDILNVDRLDANYKTGKIVYKNLAFTPVYQTLRTMWMSLLRIDKIIICLHVFNENKKTDEILIKFFDNNGQLINENLDNMNCEVVSMVTSEKYIVFAFEYFNTGKFALKLYDLDLRLVNAVALSYTPVQIHQTYCYIYVLSSTAPFVHVHDWNLEEKYAFGQDRDSNKAFFMQNVTQIYVRNEKLYVRDGENVCLKVFELNNGSLIKVINVNLVDCLLHIDSIGRIIVINQDSKILYIFDEFGKILFEYDLTYIQTITSFCITNNGHLLINDAENKALHIV
jgi:hypothetical protein